MGKNIYVNRVAINPPIGKADVTLRPGLNVIRAVTTNEGSESEITTQNGRGPLNSVGKTTFINLLDYGFGKTIFLAENKKNARNRLSKYELVMEFSIEEKKFTVIRNLVVGDVCMLFQGWVASNILLGEKMEGDPLDIEDYRNFLEVELYKGANFINGKRFISIRSIMQQLIRDQGVGFNEINKVGAYPTNGQVRRKRNEFLASFITKEKLELESRASEVKKEVDAAKKEHDIVKKYVDSKVEKMTSKQLDKKIKDTQNGYDSCLNLILQLKDRLKENQSLRDEKIIMKNNLQENRKRLIKEISIDTNRLNSYVATMNEVYSEIEHIDVAVRAKQLLGKINYQNCPVCFVELTDSFKCPNAKEEIIQNDAVRAINKILSNEKDDLKRAIELIENSISASQEEVKRIDRIITGINMIIHDDVENLLNNIEKEEKILREIEKETEKWKRVSEYYRDVSSYKQTLDALRKSIRDINDKLQKISKQIADRQKTLNNFYNYIVNYLYGGTRKGKININGSSGVFSADIDYYEEGAGTDDGAAAKTLRVISFDLAFLMLAIFGDTYHPRFLVHDSPNTNDISPDVYHRIFEFIVELEKKSFEEYGNVNFQYIITTIDLPNSIDNHEEYTRLELTDNGAEGKLFEFTF